LRASSVLHRVLASCGTKLVGRIGLMDFLFLLVTAIS
jgi:hypothetical protein